MGILDWLRRKRGKPPRGEELHRSRVEYYSSPGAFDVKYKRKRDKTEKRIKTIKDIKSSEDFDPKSKLWKHRKKK